MTRLLQLPLVLLGLAACGGPPSTASLTPRPAYRQEAYLDASGSFLPNLGAGVGLGKVVKLTTAATTSIEARLVFQFLDDEDFADDANPKAGPWYQMQAGFKRSSNPEGPRRLTTRLGAVWLRANGEPNIIQEGGDYLGLYGGFGFETDLGPSLTVGPELTVLGITRTTKLSVARPVPQINWHASIRLGGSERGGATDRPPGPGEIYVGASGLLSPGLGGGVEVGQVFRRGDLATWSFEILAEFQSPGDHLYFNGGDGRWAQARVGAKASFQPAGKGHWTTRFGAVWLRSTAPNDFLDRSGDHIGPYGSLGYEYAVGRFTTGPELNLMLVSFERETVFHLVPQLVWHATVGL